MRQSISIGRVFGIDVRIHASWLLAFAFVTWGLANGYFRFLSPRQSMGTLLLFGAISALLLFGSVLLHEFSHSLVARALGMRVRDITLFLFGGVSNIGGEAHSARDEFLVAIVGPLSSFGLAGIFWGLSMSLGGAPLLDVLSGSVRSLRGITPTLAILNYLMIVNLLLGAFNLVPAFPLDGGRVFRSIVWAITRRYGRATAIATTVGQGFGFLMIGLGVVRIGLGDVLGGLWTILIGWFVTQAAAATRRDRAMRESLEGVPASSVMDTSVPQVQQTMSVQQVVYEYLLRSERRRLIVTQDGAPVGIVEAEALNNVAREAWSTTPVGVVMVPIAFTATPEADAGDLLGRLAERNQLIPVVADDRVVGGIDLSRLMRFAELRRQLQLQVGSTRPSVV